jgi:ATP-binding cassette subfamily B protein
MRSARRDQGEPSPIFGRHGLAFGAEQKRAANPRQTMGRLWRYLGHRRAALVTTVSLVLASSLLNTATPYLLGLAIDRYMLRHDLAGLARTVLLLLGAYLASSIFTWLQTFVMVAAAQQTVREIRRDLFDRMQHFPLKFFDTHSDGDLMSRLTNDVENVNVVLSDSVIQITSGILTMVGTVIAMFWIQPILAVVSIVSVALPVAIANKWIGKVTRDAFRNQQGSLGALNGLIEETISGQRTVKAYRRERRALLDFDEHNAAYRLAATRAQTYSGFIGPMMNFTGNLGLAAVAGTGGLLSVHGMASVGLIASFIGYARQFSWPLMNIGNLLNSILSALAGAERVFETIDMEPEVDALDAPALPPVRGEVVFENVSFGYVPGKTVLRGLNLKAEPGQTVALIGPTGAGKTTIVNLLTRFYELDSGRVLIDGRDIREISKEELRKQLGVVLQDTYLFAGTIRENIRYGRLDATDEEVIGAAKLANVDQFVHHLPGGYDTLLTERGSNLSHGQRQMMAIARAVLANPRILILDEATSSVDTRTERNIQEAMVRLMHGRTSFVIAHRLSTIREADQILVIQGGEIVERGNHSSLLAQNGYYASMLSALAALETRPMQGAPQ